MTLARILARAVRVEPGRLLPLAVGGVIKAHIHGIYDIFSQMATGQPTFTHSGCWQGCTGAPGWSGRHYGDESEREDVERDAFAWQRKDFAGW